MASNRDCTCMVHPLFAKLVFASDGKNTFTADFSKEGAMKRRNQVPILKASSRALFSVTPKKSEKSLGFDVNAFVLVLANPLFLQIREKSLHQNGQNVR